MFSASEDPVTCTIKRDMLVTITIIPEHLGTGKYLKKRPDLLIFTNNVNPTFES